MTSADLVVVVVEDLHRVEVAVDDHIEQPVEQEADAVRGEVHGAVPPLDHACHREVFALANGDEPAGTDEGVDLVLDEAGALGVDADGVARQEQVGRVVVELGSLVLTKGVLDGELVDAELVGELDELLLAGGTEVDPHDGVDFGQVLGHLRHGEALLLHLAVAIHPGLGCAHRSPRRRLVRRQRIRSVSRTALGFASSGCGAAAGHGRSAAAKTRATEVRRWAPLRRRRRVGG